MINIVLMLIGFALLVKGADMFVDGAATIARKLGIPSMIVGLTIVAIGTSAPELAVSMSAALAGNADISAGNIVGSNILNLLLIVGVAALIKPIKVNKHLLNFDYVLMIASSAILYALLLISKTDILTRFSGVILMSVAIGYTIYLVKSAKKVVKESEGQIKESTVDNKSLIKKIIFGILGLVIVIYSGDLVVKNAVIIASKLGMSDTLIGLTIISLGTSLPELATTVTASLKGESDLAVGNVVGSNIFNIFLILGVTSIVSPIQFSKNIVMDLIIYLVMSILVFLGIKLGKEKIDRKLGLFFVLTYVSYVIFIFIRN